VNKDKKLALKIYKKEERKANRSEMQVEEEKDVYDFNVDFWSTDFTNTDKSQSTTNATTETDQLDPFTF